MFLVKIASKGTSLNEIFPLVTALQVGLYLLWINKALACCSHVIWIVRPHCILESAQIGTNFSFMQNVLKLSKT